MVEYPVKMQDRPVPLQIIKEPGFPAPAPDIHARLDRLSKVYPSTSGEAVVALDRVSFDVPKNRVCVLLGPSGCGKSTLLRLIAGLDFPTGGSIHVDGRLVQGPGRDRGMVFQDYTSYPWLTVRKNIEYGMRLNGVSERRQQGEEFLRLVHLEKFAESWPGQLSGGMRQRVAIARTLANRPGMLLMDEPFGALDSETRWHMQELLLEIKSRHLITVVLVTHDIDEAIFLADSIVFLRSRPGTVKEIINLDFKKNLKIDRKEDLLDHPEYRKVHRHVMKNMRSEAKE